MCECDCRQITTAPPSESRAEDLLVQATSAHVRRRLSGLLGGATPYQGAYRLSGDDGALRALGAALSVAERAEVRVVPVREDQVLFWEAQSLDACLSRLDSPWFARAAERLHFELQPIVRLAGGAVYGHEALVRAELEGRRFGAGALLDAAAAHGRARAFDARARVEAIGQAYPLLPAAQKLFINFAPGVVYNPRVCLATTFAACRAVGADFSRLVFEVTESEAFPDLALLGEILQAYRAQGARVALDDLGAGHTGLLYLRELRPDLVKLDRGLVVDLHPRDPRFALVGSLIAYAHALEIEVVAEGIETAAELEAVRALGADYAQGYLLGRPQRRPEARVDLPGEATISALGTP